MLKSIFRSSSPQTRGGGFSPPIGGWKSGGVESPSPGTNYHKFVLKPKAWAFNPFRLRQGESTFPYPREGAEKRFPLSLR